MDYIIEIIPPIFDGFKVVLLVYTFTLFIAMPLGLLVALLMKDNQTLQKIIGIFTWIVRGTPLLLQLYIMMYGIPLLLPIRMNRLVTGTLTFIINYTAYYIEIFRSGLAIIPLGQVQAGEVLGLSKMQISIHILLPQVFRNTLLPLINEAITLVKDTSLLAAIAIGEMLRNAREIVARDLRVEPLLVAGAIYLLFSLVVVRIGKQIEGKVLEQR